MSKVTEIVLWLVLGSLAVLVIMNPVGFATGFSALASGATSIMTVLTGSGYKRS